MQLQRQSPICSVDLIICAGLGHVQNRVIVESHGHRVRLKLDNQVNVNFAFNTCSRRFISTSDKNGEEVGELCSCSEQWASK